MELNETFRAVRRASRKLALMEEEQINAILRGVADEIDADAEAILKANAEDLARMDKANPKYDRLKLTEQRLADIAADMRNVASLPSPLNRVIEERVRPNGLKLKKVSVPFGVIGVIYEARPNVSFDVFALCLKSGNACILKGGSDAESSNRAIVDLIHRVLDRMRVDTHVVALLPSGREATAELLHAEGWVDLIIPRGSSSLIEFVRKESVVPVIETGAGICHTYFDAAGEVKKGAAIIHNAKTRRVSVCNALDCLLVHAVIETGAGICHTYFDAAGEVKKGAAIIHNAKTRRVSVCNALDCLLVHASRLADLPALCEPLKESKVVIYADERAYEVLAAHYPEQWLIHADAHSYSGGSLSGAVADSCRCAQLWHGVPGL